jgi:hypothetical protein
MAKAVMPLHAFREHFGLLSDDAINLTIKNLALQYLREHAASEKKREAAKS